MEAIDGNRALLDLAREVRGKAAVLFGFLKDWRKGEQESPSMPMIGFVSPPATYGTLNGAEVREDDMDLRVRLLFMNRLHDSIAGTGSICLAAASRVQGSVVQEICCNRAGDVLLIGHPSGVTPTKVKANPRTSRLSSGSKSWCSAARPAG